MSDIFISYKREDQPIARKLADALEGEGWTVWWDPKLRAGERFNDVIERALRESKCVVVMWSKRSVESQYVKHEANYALKRNKLVPVMIEEDVELPFRFEDLHTPSLLDWDGSKDSSEFQRLVDDIIAIIGSPVTQGQKGQAADIQQSIFRDKLKDGSEGPEMVAIPAGRFLMGDIDIKGDRAKSERPSHTVHESLSRLPSVGMK
jgi:formylglycine-generating enzyme required for sulfatase activity